MSGWLQTETVREEFEKKQAELHDFAIARGFAHRMPKTVCMAHSIGLTFPKKGDVDRATYYVLPPGHELRIDGQSPEQHEVVYWTHWVGRVVLEVKTAVEQNGCVPSAIVYPFCAENDARPVGPWVRYEYADGQLSGHPLLAPGDTAQSRGREAADSTLTGFGLHEIVERRDLDQDEVIRLPMDGVHVLTGGPGVGKTTVALHRISYLLNEQVSYMEKTGRAPAGQFFREADMQVVVWKDHLVRYLESCLKELGHLGVKVRHAEDWVSMALRSHIRFGDAEEEGAYRKCAEDDWAESVKLGDSAECGAPWRGFTEVQLSAFLFGRDEQGEYHWSVARKLASDLRALRSALATDLEGLAGVADIVRLVTDASVAPDALVAVKEQVSGRLEREIARAKDIAEARRSFDPVQRQRQADAAGAVSRLAKALERFRGGLQRLERSASFDYGGALYEFYQSRFVYEQLVAGLGQAKAERFLQEQDASARARMLSTADRYLLLWIVHLWTRRGILGDRQPLSTYCHIVVDEAQYFTPIVLKLLVDLCREPLRSMTVVGDLQQKSRSGGLGSWDDLRFGEQIPTVYRLKRAYRWSPEIFRFLSFFQEYVRLDDPLEQPSGGAVGNRPKPAVVSHQSIADEDRWLVKSIQRIRKAGSQTIVVCVANYESPRWDELVVKLKALDLRVRRATGEDVRECEEKIIITDLDSVVGLEFGAVLLPSIEQTLGQCGVPVEPEALKRAWVPMTRASNELLISYVGSVAILGEEAFAGWLG